MVNELVSWMHTSAHVPLGPRRTDQWQCFPEHQKHLPIDRGSFDGTKILLSPVGDMLTSTLDIFEDDEKHGLGRPLQLSIRLHHLSIIVDSLH